MINEMTRKKTIMVVDDDESILSFLSFSLRGEGFKVLEARLAQKALTLIETQTPDLILLDIMLPQMDGFSMCKLLRSNPKFSRIPVIFITAYGDPASLNKTKAAGAQGLIEKPIMFDELLLQVLDGLNGRFSLPTRLKFSTEPDPAA